jgi:hypothetical protein
MALLTGDGDPGTELVTLIKAQTSQERPSDEPGSLT